MTEFVPIAVVAEAAGKSRRALEIAAARIIQGKTLTWNGARLIVRSVFARGGKAGFQYEISLESLPVDLQDRLKRRLTTVAAPSNGGAARLERDIWRHIISRIILHPKGTDARVSAAKAEAEQKILNPRTGQFEPYSLSTIMRRVKLFEHEGEARLGRQRRSDAGEKRVILSAAWDKSVPFNDATKERIAQDLRSYIRSQHKNLAAFGHVQMMAKRKLQQLTRAAGFELTPGLCAIPENFIKSEKVARKAGVFLRDRKAFQDDLPGVLRGISGLAPCDIVYGDVHSVDIILEKAEGFQRHAKFIAWFDAGTQRAWLDVVLLEEGKGVTNAHVIESFLRMASEWGMPGALYLDNGSEYNWAEFVDDAMKLMGPKLIFGRDSGVVNAKPYNARAKEIEGFFGRFERHYLVTVPGWIGGDRMKSKTSNVGKAPTPFSGGFDHFVALVQAHLTLYHNRPQKGRKLKGLSPFEAYEKAIAAGWAKTEIDPAAFVTASSTEERRRNRQGRVEFKGASWTCDGLQSCLDEYVTVLVPKYQSWDRLPIRDEKGRPIGLASRDVEFHPLDPAGAREAGARSGRRLKGASCFFRRSDRPAPARVAG